MADHATKLVILAAGMGTRMRRDERVASLSGEQRAVASTGVKALIPVGRPFLDYALNRAADAGLRHVCLVIGSRHDRLRQYYAELAPRRLRITFAVQDPAVGTADAVAAAESFVGADPFLVLNADNCYPTAALRDLREADGPAVVGFDRDALVANSDLTHERIARFAILQRDSEGYLQRIQEKPDAAAVHRMKPPVLVGMNCWRFSAGIFQACRDIEKSARGEYELPDAVSRSMQVLGERYQVIQSEGPVLDLSSQRDIAGVKLRLQGEDVQL